MSGYSVPVVERPQQVGPEEVLLVANGDLRQSANKVCWPAQAQAEEKIIKAFAAEGITLRRAHLYREDVGHGFIWNQRMGMDVFATIDPTAALIVAESVWQYSGNILAGLRSHRGPILTMANWSGQWPGLVGMLNLNACLRKAGVKFSTIWSEDFTDAFARKAAPTGRSIRAARGASAIARAATMRTTSKPSARQVRRASSFGRRGAATLRVSSMPAAAAREATSRMA